MFSLKKRDGTITYETDIDVYIDYFMYVRYNINKAEGLVASDTIASVKKRNIEINLYIYSHCFI